MRKFPNYLYKNSMVIGITFAVAVMFNFLFSLVYLIQDCGNVHFKSLLDDMSIVVVVPKKTDKLALKILEENIYTDRMTRDVTFVSSDQAWEKLKKDIYINADFEKYSSGNLPHIFVIKPEYAPTSEMISFISQLKIYPGVKDIIYDKITLKWLNIFEGYMEYSRLIFLALCTVMVFSVILLAVLFMLIKNYSGYLPFVYIQSFTGFCGGVAGFVISYFSLKSIYVEPAVFSGMPARYTVFVVSSGVVVGMLIAFFTTVMSKEVKVAAY